MGRDRTRVRGGLTGRSGGLPMAGRRMGHYGAAMGIETILIVIGVAVVIAVAVGASRAKRKAGGTQAPKPQTPSDVDRG